MSDYIYSDVSLIGNKLYISAYDTASGEKKYLTTKQINNLKLYHATKGKTDYKSFIGDYNLNPVPFQTIKDYKDYLYDNSNIQGLGIYGQFPLEKIWISNYFQDEIASRPELINIGFFDIETTMLRRGKPDPIGTPERITAITLYSRKSKTYYVFADQPVTARDFTEKDHENCKIHFFTFTPDFEGEFFMLKKFAYICNEVEKIDVLSAYFGDLFDNPYIYNRTAKLARDKHLYPKTRDDDFDENCLSPLRSTYTTNKGDVILKGIQLIDYFKIYEKYVEDKKLESWKLDFIATKELNEQKVKYEGTLQELYERDYEAYLYYNFQDVRLLRNLDEKLGFFDLHMDITYVAKQNLKDTISPVRTWETLIYNRLLSQNIILNPAPEAQIKRKYVGAYTHNPIPGFYLYPMSFDLNSLYPHLIMKYYISPETILSEKELYEIFPNNLMLVKILELKAELERVSNELPYDKVKVGKAYDNVGDMIISNEIDLSFLKGTDVVMAPSLEFFRKDSTAVLPYFMRKFYNMRKKVKSEMLLIESKLELLKDKKNKTTEIKNQLKDLEEKYVELQKIDKLADVVISLKTRAKKMKLRQHALKILLNSVYGAFGNAYFRFFDIRLAKAITSGGRIAIRSMMKYIETELRTFYKNFAGKDWTGKDFFIYCDTDSVYLNIEPLMPAIVTIYKDVILASLIKKWGNSIAEELDAVNFWDNIVDHFESNSEIIMKYFKAHDVLEENGLINNMLRVELPKSENKAFKDICSENDLQFIFRRKGNEDTVNYFFMVGENESEEKERLIKQLCSDKDVKLKYVKNTYVLDDFADTVIQDIIQENYNQLAEKENTENTMAMKRETICVNGLWVASKNYFLNVIDSEGVRYSKPKTKITGFLNSSSIPRVVSAKLVDFIKLLMMQHNPSSPESKALLDDFINKFGEEFMTLPPEVVGVSKKVNYIDNYTDAEGSPTKGAPINTFASVVYNKYVKDSNDGKYEVIQEGEKMKYVYLKEPNVWNAHVVGYKGTDLPEVFKPFVDMDLMRTKTFYDVVSIILEAVDIELDFSRDSIDIFSLI